MIDNKKYTYWLKKDDKLNDEIVWREMYSRFGYIFHTIQMVEYNIANILAIEEFEKETKRVFTDEDIDRIRKNIDKKFNKLSKMTFGVIAKEVEKSEYLRILKPHILKEVVDCRNYLAHKCFKEKLLNHELEKIEDVDSFVDELNAFEGLVIELNEIVLIIFKKHKIKSVFLIPSV